MPQETPIISGGNNTEPQAQAKPDPKAAQTKTAPPPITFESSEFLIQESTGSVIGTRGEKKSGSEKLEVNFSPELAKQYENFLYGHLQNLLKITNPQDLNNDAHRHELQLRNSLTTNHQPDREKIKDYLESPGGWMITTQLFEDVTAEKLFATGLDAATRPRGERVEQIDENTIRLNMDQGLLNRAIMDHVWPWLNERVNITAGRPEERGYAGGERLLFGRNLSDIRRWQSMLSQAAIAIPLGGAAFITDFTLSHNILQAAVVGYLTSRVVPGTLLLRNLLNNGVTIDLRQCTAALQSIQNDPAEMAYLNAVLGIDANNFVVNGNRVTLRAGHGLSPNNIREIQKEIFQGLYAREEFYTSLGIPGEVLDALPNQYLYSYKGGRAEQTGTRWQKRLDEIFQPQTTGIRDTAGRSPNHANFDANNLDYAGNLQRYSQARRQVIMEMMTDQAIKVKDGGEAADAITRYTTKISDRQAGGDEMKKRTQVIEDRKTELTKQKTELNETKTNIDQYTEARKALETSSVEFRRDFEIAALNALAAGRTAEEGIKDEITRLRTSLTVDAAGNIAHDRRIAKDNIRDGARQGLVDAVTAVQAAIRAAGPDAVITTESRRDIEKMYIDQATETAKTQLEEVERQVTEAKTQLVKLEDLQKRITAAKRVLDEKSDVVLGTAKENLTDLQTQYGTLIGWGIGVIELRNLSVEELMTRINAINVATPANGWPQTQNSDPATRMRVVNAIVEAKAQFEETFDSQKAVRDPHYTRITGWAGTLPAAPPITPDQLRTMSENQLLVLIHNINAANIAQGWLPASDAAELPNLRLAMEEAKNRMIIRHNAAATERIKDLEAQIKAEDKRITDINFEGEKDVLQVTSDLMLRQGKIFEMAYDVASDSERYTNINPVDSNDPTFSATEKASLEGAVPPVGYWRVMNALFGYEKRTDRSVYVSKLLKVLPPKALARRINIALGMPPGDPNIENITVAFTQLNTKINNKTFTGVDVRSMFRDIINGLRMQADAI